MPVTIGDGLSFCGHAVREDELDLIRQITREFGNLALTELAATICELLQWRRPNEGLKARECYLFLRELHRRGWLPWLPPPRPSNRRAPLAKLTNGPAPAPPLADRLTRFIPAHPIAADPGRWPTTSLSRIPRPLSLSWLPRSLRCTTALLGSPGQPRTAAAGLFAVHQRRVAHGSSRFLDRLDRPPAPTQSPPSDQ